MNTDEKSIVRLNAEKDPFYAPYCMRCGGLYRMQRVVPFYWHHLKCGAVHDERREGDPAEFDNAAKPKSPIAPPPHWKTPK